jgi:hypothetical protein
VRILRLLRPVALLLAAAAAPALGAGVVAGQGRGADLDRVEALIQAGDHEGARRGLEAWWDAAGDRAPRNELQRGLWFRALLTQEGERAELDYQRLVLEYPGGSYSDLALLRLGHAAHARGDLQGAGAHFDRLLRDYPGSAHRGEAERWLSRNAGGRSASSAGAPGATGPWAVQLGAFSSASGAREVAERARSAGFEPRLVRTPGTELVRVRLGSFPDEAGARGLLQQIRARGLEATVVGDADRESPAG